RHYLARLHRKTLCYSKSEQMLRHSIRLLIHYLKFEDVLVPYSNPRNYFPPNARHFA
ncbi:MAG: IS1 family transposase, partial [Microcystis aeruginosa LG13-03]|nr:IS1 family transposase [Microcystis aeruginosa LG13-13]NCR06601.1 IS1 family transposase [Microcystis aeruginosa LG13-03]NCR64815.1 IS1 family transposase [Microcystis aeruginosa LG11-05]NCR73768.1 IS1 family transposase [Microcystis aeruginosa LG13-12]